MHPETFEQYRAHYRSLYQMVKQDHEQSGLPHQGHGFDHDVCVALTGVQLGDQDWHLADMAFVAGMIHSTDRFVPHDQLSDTLDRYLQHVTGHLSDHDIAGIKEAVLRHTEYKDKDLETRSDVQKILMDADKLVNMNLLLVVRAGQFRPDIPAIETAFVGTRNPASSYREPTSVIEDLHGALEWAEPGWFHSKHAEDRAQVLAKQLRQYIRQSESLFIELGIAGIDL